jgi:tetratricopeptide (TPR) repeat protein
MSLVSLILPCGKQYRLSTSKNAIACLNQLQQKGELEGRISGDTFVVRKAFKRKLRRLFSPEVQGLLTAQQPETVIQVVTAPSASAASLINSILSTLVGVAVGLLASSVLVPSTVPKVYALLWTALVPILVITAAAMISRLVAKKDAQFVLTQIADCFESHWSPDPNGIAVSIHNTARQQIMTGSVACLVFIAISSFTNSMIERCWIAGNFEKVESFCRPATQIVETLIGADNIVAEECRFPLAEALRVERPAQFREAESIYETNLLAKNSYLKGNNLILANNSFSLARVLDQTGRHSDADKTYRQAIEYYEQTEEVGSRGALLAKTLDRLAMLCLKERNYEDAEKFEKRALEIDTANGDIAGRSIGEDLNDLALVYDQQEKYDRAREFYKQAVDYKTKHLAPVDYSLATSLYNLAEVEKLSGDTKDYAIHSSQAYEIWKKLLRFKASYEPLPEKIDSADASELKTNYARNGMENGVSVPDPMSCYLRIMHATRADYEQPNCDARFDGLRPYLGRE